MSRKGDNIYCRRDGRYEGRYKKGRKEDGTLQYGYVYGRTKTEAKRKLKDKQKQFSPQLWEKEKETLAWWINKWLEEWVKEQIAVTSYALYERLARLHILPALGSCSLIQIKEEDIRRFISGLIEKNLSNRTINHICGLLSRALKQAGEEGYLEKVPAIRRLKEEKKTKGKSLSAGERKILDQYLETQNDPAVFTGAHLGLRLGEICALQWDDLDLENGFLYVRRSVQCIPLSDQVKKLLNTDKNRKTTYLIKSPKTPDSNRVIPLPDFVVRQFLLLKEKKFYEGNGFVFGTRTRPAKPRTIQKRFSSVCKKCFGKSYGFHTLRHTFATRFMEKCNNPEMLRSLLGHSSVNITLGCYVHSDEESKRKAMEKVFTRVA